MTQVRAPPLKNHTPRSTKSRNTIQVIFMNQIRMKIGVMSRPPQTPTGGNALNFTLRFQFLAAVTPAHHTARSGRRDEGVAPEPRQGRE